MFGDACIDRKIIKVGKKIIVTKVEIEVTTRGDWEVVIGKGHVRDFRGAGDVHLHVINI